MRTDLGRHTFDTLKGPSQLGESLWSPSWFRIRRRTKFSIRSSLVHALLTVGECTEPDAPPCRRRSLDVDPPAEPGVTCARMRRRSTPSRHCLCASGEAAARWRVAEQLPSHRERPIRCRHRLGHGDPLHRTLQSSTRCHPGWGTARGVWHG
jgi:hypothetical protein